MDFLDLRPLAFGLGKALGEPPTLKVKDPIWIGEPIWEGSGPFVGTCFV